MGEAPQGLRYAEDFLTPQEEHALAAQVEALPFQDVVMRGVKAKRTVAHFGWTYGFESWRIHRGAELPVFLLDLRARCAAFAGVAEERLTQALVNRYPPGAGIGWHRDAPMFGPVVVGVSLLSPCRLRLRRGRTHDWTTHERVLAPRSVYVLEGAARSSWQHSIPATEALRYSITFRSVVDEARWRGA